MTMGGRERSAIVLWWSLEAKHADVGTLDEATRGAKYDPIDDVIIWRDLRRTVAEINAMPEMHVERKRDISNDVEAMLTSLNASWDVRLCHNRDAAGWELSLIQPAFRVYIYRGHRLGAVVRRAWAGEPPDNR